MHSFCCHDCYTLSHKLVIRQDENPLMLDTWLLFQLSAVASSDVGALPPIVLVVLVVPIIHRRLLSPTACRVVDTKLHHRLWQEP